MSDDRATGKIVAVLNDLIFETKIRSTAQALAALGTPSPDPQLNAVLLQQHNNFLNDSAQLLIDLGNAANIRDVEVVMHALSQFVDAIWTDVRNEIGRVDPAIVLPPHRGGIAGVLQTQINNTHIGRAPLGRGTRRDHKRTLQALLIVVNGLPLAV